MFKQASMGSVMNAAKSFAKGKKAVKATSAVANTVKSNIAASQAARKASQIGQKGFTQGFKDTSSHLMSPEHLNKTRALPTNTQVRIERGYAKSKGVKLEDRGNVKPKAKVEAPKAPGSDFSAKFKDMTKNINKRDMAIGAGGVAAGALATGGEKKHEERQYVQ